MLEGGIIDPFKGPVSPGLVQIGSWTSAVNQIILTNVFLIIGAILISYIGTLMAGFESKKALIVPVIVAVIGFLGVYYTNKSISEVIYQVPAPLALKTRNFAAYLKAASILIAFIIATVGTGSLYMETKTKAYAFYALSYLLGAIGWAIGASTWLTSFERMAVLQLIQEGTLSTPLKIFTVSAFFIVIGSVGLLLASIIDVISSASAGVEELEFEEIEEEVPVEEEEFEEESVEEEVVEEETEAGSEESEEEKE